MISCSTCFKTKAESEYYKDASQPTGYKKHCKQCRNEVQAAYQKTDAGKLALLKAKMKYRYGITLEKYLEISKAQGDVCYLCELPETMPRGDTAIRLAVDHDHACCPSTRSCGRCIRGLLCYNCNMYMGKVDRCPALQVRFADYRARRVLEL